MPSYVDVEEWATSERGKLGISKSNRDGIAAPMGSVMMRTDTAGAAEEGAARRP